MMRIARILTLLFLALLLGYICVDAVGRYSGDRVYLKNSSICTIHLISEHDGQKAEPGETILLKSGFVERTPTMLIAHAKGIWVGGLHFSADKFSVRGEADRDVPAQWMQKSFFGRRLGFDLKKNGQLDIAGPNDKGATQPQGFPFKLPLGDGEQPCAA